MRKSYQAWSSLVEGGKGTYLPNGQTYLVIALFTLSLLFIVLQVHEQNSLTLGQIQVFISRKLPCSLYQVINFAFQCDRVKTTM